MIARDPPAQSEARPRLRRRRWCSRSCRTCSCAPGRTAAGWSSSIPTRCRRCWSTRATTPRSSKTAQERRARRSYLADCLQTATWLIRALDQRAKTILKVATEIVRQQDAFLAHGVQHLRPLNLKTVADAIGMHESTVSRVTANKYMATSRGIFELKYFFTSAIAAADGGEAHSAEAVRHRIKQLIDAESAQRRAVRRHHRGASCARPASTSPAARLRNIARRCASRRRCSGGARSRHREWQRRRRIQAGPPGRTLATSLPCSG